MQKIVILLSCLVCLAAAGRLGLERKQWWLQNVHQEQDSHKWGTTEKDVQQRQKFLLDVLLQVQKPLVNRELIELGKVLINDPAAYIEPKDEILLEFLEHCRQHNVLTPAEIYSDISMEHGRQMVGLTKFLTLAKDWTTFQHNVCFARLHLNPVMFVTALQMAVQERKDTEMLVMPAMNEILPHLFYDQDVITTAENVGWHELVTKKSTIKPSMMHVLGLGNIMGMMSPVHWIRMGKAGLWRPWQERHMTMMGERSGRMGGQMEGRMSGIMGEHNMGEINGHMGGQWKAPIVGPIVGPVVGPITASMSGQIGDMQDRNILVQSEEKIVIPVEQQNSLSYLTDDVGLNIFWNHAMNGRLVQTWTKNKHQSVRRVEDKTKPWEQRKWQGVWSDDETNRNHGQQWNTVEEEQWRKKQVVDDDKWKNDKEQQWWKKQGRVGLERNTGAEQQRWHEQQMGQQGKQSSDWHNMRMHGEPQQQWEESMQHERMQGQKMDVQDEELPWWKKQGQDEKQWNDREEQQWWKKQGRVGEEMNTGEEQKWWEKRGRTGTQMNSGEEQLWWKKAGHDGQQINTGEQQMWWEKQGRGGLKMHNDDEEMWWKKTGHGRQQMNAGEDHQWWNEQMDKQSGDWHNMRMHGEPQQEWEERMQHERMHDRKMDQHLPTTNTENARLLHVNRRRQNVQQNWLHPSSMSGHRNPMGVETGKHWNQQDEQADNVEHQRAHWTGVSNGRVVMHGDNDMPWNSHKTDKRGGSMWRHEVNNEGDWMKHENRNTMPRHGNWHADNHQDWNSMKQHVNEGRQIWHEPSHVENPADWINTESVVGMHSNNDNMNDEITWRKQSTRMHAYPIDNVQKWGRIIDNVDEHVDKQGDWNKRMESTPVKGHSQAWSWTNKQQQPNNWWQQRSIIDGDRLMSRRTNDDDWMNAQHDRPMDWSSRRTNDDDWMHVQQSRHTEQWPRRNNDDDWMNTQQDRHMDQWSNRNNDNDESMHTRSRVPRSIKTIDISPTQELINARSGEMFIQNMQQLMARINMETISLAQTGMKIEKLMDRQHQRLTTNGKQYQQKIMTPVQTQVKIQQCMQQLKHIIDQELQRAQVRPNDAEIVKIIGDILVEQNGELGNVWEELYNEINVAVYGLESMNTKATPLSVPVSNMREPLYQHILTSLNELIWSYKQHLQPYQPEQLRVPGVHVKHVEVDDLVTYFDVSDADLINLVDQQLLQSDINNMQKLEKQLVARQQRLNHKHFTLSYDIDAEHMQRVVVRTFLGPKVNEHGRAMPLDVSHQHHMLLDAFVKNLIPGSNKIVRNSRDIMWTSRDTSSLSEIYHSVMQGTSMQHLVGGNCRFPQRLLLPRGTTSGLPMQLLVVVTPVTEEDRVLQQLVHPEEGLCGMGIAAMHLDNLPLNFPLDRKIVNVMDFMQPNMLIKDVMIMHEEHVDVGRI